jgi:glycine C-acetyltransferase
MASTDDFFAHLRNELQGIRDAGLYKAERIIATPQGAHVRTTDGREVINLCANNYLGLSSHPAVIEAAHEALRTHGYGLSSVRFICGTQDIHKTLEARLARFLGTEDAILYAAAFDANGGLFEPLLGEKTPSSATSSTTPPSSTASACARRSVGATSTTT